MMSEELKLAKKISGYMLDNKSLDRIISEVFTASAIDCYGDQRAVRARREALEELDSPKLMEILADIEHERWAGWMRYLFSKCEGNTIPDWGMEHWNRQANTPYTNLTEKEKESDREEVRKTLTAIRKLMDEPEGEL